MRLYRQEVVRFAIVDSDGFVMSLEVSPEVLDNPAGRKLIASDLREMRREIRRTRGTRVRPEDE